MRIMVGQARGYQARRHHKSPTIGSAPRIWPFAMTSVTPSIERISLSASTAQTALLALRDPEKARFFNRLFKAGPGQYGEGDRFLGLTVPAVRTLAKQFAALPLV
jgi:hypothetical protein